LSTFREGWRCGGSTNKQTDKLEQARKKERKKERLTSQELTWKYVNAHTHSQPGYWVELEGYSHIHMKVYVCTRTHSLPGYWVEGYSGLRLACDIG